MNYKDLTFEELEKVIKEYYEQPKTRKVNIHPMNQAAYDLFHDALLKQGFEVPDNIKNKFGSEPNS